MYEATSTYDQLLRAIRSTRRRWRMKTLVRGLVVVLGAGFLFFAMSSLALDRFHYSDRAVSIFRILMWVSLLGLILRFLILPLRRRLDDRRVALYIEENEPTIHEEILSAVEIGSQGSAGASPALVERLLNSAIESCERIDYGSGIERGHLRRFSAALAGTAAAGMLAILLSPALFQQSALLLFLPWRGDAVANPYSIDVVPGHLTVARGADQEIVATLQGFDSRSSEIAIRRGGVGDWERWPMASHDDSGQRVFMILDLQSTTEYFVEAGGIRSTIFRIDVADLPYVESMTHEYQFPSYTGLSPMRVENGGDIAALRGTEVHLEIVSTIEVPAARVRIEDSGEDRILALVRDGDVWRGSLAILSDTFYQIEMAGHDGELTAASSEYAIEVLDDQPPILSFEDPGRDVRSSKVEEVYVEVRGEDDYGIARLDLFYSVNGGEERRVQLSRGGAPKELVAGHTFFLEEEELFDGDFISYYARAVDANNVGGRGTVTSDIYFIEISPFSKNYRQAQQGGGEGQGGGEMSNGLSQRQRLIVSATFKLINGRETYSERDFLENLTTISLMQGRLREQVENLITRMGNRMRGEEEFESILVNLEQAKVEMEPAIAGLDAGRPKDALPAEQRALKFLQRAEATFRDVQVSRQSGGGSGEGAQRMAEDLADLFELELDKLHNQYETVQRGERQQLQKEIDEALQKLEELARRQQQENERARRLASQMGSSSAGGGGQRRLIEETEELARQLERLSRQQSRPDLAESARRLQDAADQMKQAMSERSSGQVGVGDQALDELRKARRLLEKNQQTELSEELNDLQSRSERIGRLQERIQDQVSDLEAARGGESGGEPLQGLLNDKDELATEVADLESQIDQLARESRSTQKEASRQLGEASGAIRRNQLKEKIRYSKGVVRGRSKEYAERFEDEISSDIAEVQERIGEAADSIQAEQGDQSAGALDDTRDLVRGLESMQERIQQRSRSAQAGSQTGSEEGSKPGDEAGESSPGSQPGDSEGGEQRAQADGSGRQGTAAGQEPGESGEAGQQPGRGGAEDGDSAETSRMGQGGGTGSFQPGVFNSEDLRQLAGEFSRRLDDAEQLNRDLRSAGIEAQDLDRILQRMRDFDIRGINRDPLALELLRDDIVEGLKQFEFRLWRELEDGEGRLYLAGSDEVPEGYREMVEEYFTSLSQGQ